MENTVGLSVLVCPWPDCRRLNALAAGEPKRMRCHACGRSLDATDTAARGEGA
jgi:hypothetical protein